MRLEIHSGLLTSIGKNINTSMSPEQSCTVPGCLVTQSHPNVKWFTLPDQTSLISSFRNGKIVYYCRRRLWLEKLGISDGPLEKHAVICSTHFTEEDFVDNHQGNAVLKDDAVPSRNLPLRTDYEATDPLSTSIDTPDPNRKENDIETVEKSDEEDDDVEIIEPHREIITLDDDDATEKDAEPVEKKNPTKGLVIVKSFANINNNPIEKIKKTDAHSTLRKILNDGNDKESSSNLKCMSPEAITHSLKGAINKRPTARKSDTPQSAKSVLLKKKVANLKEPENGNTQCHYMISEGKKYLIQMTKTTLPKSPQASVSSKTSLPPNVAKIIIPKEKLFPVPLSKEKKAATITDKNMSKALKKQLLEWIQNTPNLKEYAEKKEKPESKGKNVRSPLKAVRILNVSPPNKSQSTEASSSQVPKTPADTSNRSLLKSQNGNAAKTSTDTGDSQAFNIPTSAEGFIPLPNGFVGKIISQNPVPPLIYLPQGAAAATKVPIPRINSKKPVEKTATESKAEKVDTFKFVNIEDIMKNKIVKEEASESLNKDELSDKLLVDKSTKEKNEETIVSTPFSDIYKFIKKTMLGHVLDVSGKKYVLKECGLNFVPADSQPGDPKRVALISSTSISSTDKSLLNAMNCHIGNSEIKECTKKILFKPEKILKDADMRMVKLNNTMKKNYVDNKIVNTNKEKFAIQPVKKTESKKKEKPPPKKKILRPEKNQNINVFTKNDKVVISPKSVTLINDPKQVNNIPIKSGNKIITGASSTSQDEETNREKRILKRKKICKASLARSRRILKLPISQMQPTMRGRLPVDRNRIRKMKKFTIETPEERRSLVNTEIQRQLKTDSPSNKRNLKRERFEENNTDNEKTSPIRTRSTTRGQKKNYRNLSVYGTTEVIKKPKMERKNLSLGESEPKKLKYSDKVGDIESFLEVVLEPENKELIQNSNVIEATMNGVEDSVE